MGGFQRPTRHDAMRTSMRTFKGARLDFSSFYLYDKKCTSVLVYAAMKAGINTDDRADTVSLMAPLVFSEGSRHRGPLTDLAFDLTQKSAGFRRSLPSSLVT